MVGSSEGEVRETHDALRRLKAPVPGKRPFVPPEPEAQGAAGLPGLLSWWWRRCLATTATVSFHLAENLTLTKKEEEETERRRKLKEEAKHVTRVRELDHPKKAGERLSAPDDDAWRRWKSVSLASPHGKRG